MEPMKFKVRGIKHFVMLQRAAFAAGCTWADSTTGVMYIDTKWMFINSLGKMSYCRSSGISGTVVETYDDRTIDDLKAMRNDADPEPKYKSGSMIYVASPYSAGLSDMDSDTAAEVMEDRYEAVKSFIAKHMKTQCVFSPIVHAHSIAADNELPKTFKYWAAINHDYLSRCSELWVLTMPDWDVSRGVADEIRFAVENGIPVKYINDDGE